MEIVLIILLVCTLQLALLFMKEKRENEKLAKVHLGVAIMLCMIGRYIVDLTLIPGFGSHDSASPSYHFASNLIVLILGIALIHNFVAFKGKKHS